MSTHMQENDIHLQPDVLLLREEQQNQAIVTSNKASHKNECHLNSSVKINATNEMKSTRFKSCKYHKKLMAITQMFAEESCETLSLQSRGLTTPNILEFAECIKSTSHKLSDISHHLLQCSNLIKKKHFESVNGLTHKKVQYRSSSSGTGHESTSSTKPRDHQDNSVTSSTTKKSFNCYLCSRKMSRKLELFQHFTNEHSIMMYKCSKCHKTFASNVSFYSHLKAHKCGLYTCQICDKSFDLRPSWFNHMKIHQVEKYKCQVSGCNYTCQSELTFRQHSKYYHLSKKTVPCK